MAPPAAVVRVAGIDIGLRNIAVCIMEDGVVVFLDREDLFDGEAVAMSKVHDAAYAWVWRHAARLLACDAIAVEEQYYSSGGKSSMSSMLLIAQATIMSVLRPTAQLVLPMTVKRHFGTVTNGGHRINKAAAVGRVDEIYGETLLRRPPGSAGTRFRRLHDMADSVLLARYMHDQVLRRPVNFLASAVAVHPLVAVLQHERHAGQPGCTDQVCDRPDGGGGSGVSGKRPRDEGEELGVAADDQHQPKVPRC